MNKYDQTNGDWTERQTLPENERTGEIEQPFLQRGTTAYRNSSLALFAAGLATFAVLYCVQPLFPIYSAQFGLSPAAASLSLSVSTLLLAVTLPIAGFISDAVGRKTIMVASLGLSSVFCAVGAFAPDFTSLLIVRAFQGIVLAGLPAVAMAYLIEEVEPKSIGFAMGLYVSGNTVGGLLGRIVSGMMTEAYSWRLAVGTLACISFIAGLYFWRSLPPSRHFRPQRVKPQQIAGAFARQFRDPGLVCLFLIAALLMGGFVSLYNYLGFRLIDAPFNLSHAVAGWIFILYLLGTFSSSWMGRMGDRIGRPKVLWISVVLMFVGVLLTLSNQLAVTIFGVAVVTFGFFGAHSTASSWVGQRAAHGKAQASSLYLLFYYVGSSIGGSVSGIFWTEYRWHGVVGMILVMLALAAAASVILPQLPVHPIRSRKD
jgi:YNFM family putative membrane transporter